ncbi:MAG: hypothetical protein E3J72_17770 [Planctomycetota bacterium]|nr:MAG: hypothetical protein E3J72_17770 [Planctomycetota bacterium]
MAKPSPEIIGLSSDAVEKIISWTLREASSVLGKRKLSSLLGLTRTRLDRLISSDKQVRLTFDVIYRMHVQLGLTWPGIFTPSWIPAVWKLQKEWSPKSEAFKDEVILQSHEQKVRERIRKIVSGIGLTKCAAGCALPKGTLQTHLQSMNVPVSLIWRIHLHTGKPYTALLTGSMDENEEMLREGVGEATDLSGRLEDLYEPVICVAGSYIREGRHRKAAPYQSILRGLLDKRLSVPQTVRLCKLLAYYEKQSGSEDRAENTLRKAWKRIARAKDQQAAASLEPWLMDTAIEMRLTKLAKEIGDRIISTARETRALTVAYFQLAVVAFSDLEFFEAERLFRMSRMHSLKLEQKPYRQYLRARIYVNMAHILWAFGEGKDSLGKVDALLEETSLESDWKLGLLYLKIAILLWERNIPECLKAFRSYKSIHETQYGKSSESSTVTLLQTYVLLAARKTEKGVSSTDEKRLVNNLRNLGKLKTSDISGRDRIMLGICRYMTDKDSSILKAVTKEIISGKIFSTESDIPLEFLPHFLEAAKEAGFLSKQMKSWKEEMMKKGLLYLDITRENT